MLYHELQLWEEGGGDKRSEREPGRQEKFVKRGRRGKMRGERSGLKEIVQSKKYKSIWEMLEEGGQGRK